MVQMNPFAGQQWKHRDDRLVDTEWNKWRGWDNGENRMETHTNTTVCKIDSQLEFAVWFRELKPGLCDNLDVH